MSEIWTLEPRRCGKCGKEMYPTPQWVYKEGRIYYCSWKCFNHRFDGIKKNEQKNYHYKPVEQLTLDGKPVQIFKDAYEASTAIGCSIQWMRDACQNGKACKKYLWRYVEDPASENENK